MFQFTNNKKVKKDRFSQLYDILNTISAAKDMKGLLEKSLNKTLALLSSERGSIFLAGDDGKELSLKWAQDVNSTLSSDIKRKIGEGVLGKVARDRKAVLVRDIRSDERFKITNASYEYKTNSFLCAPIATDMRLIGVMSITENKSKKPYSEQDLRILEIIAGHIALKIEKSQLLSRIDRLKKEAEQNGKFTDLGKIAGGISHELNSPLDGVIRYVNLALNSIEEGVAREYLLEAKGGLLRIANIIRSLLQLVRQKKSSSYKWIDVNKTIEKSIDLMRYQAMYKGVDIKKDFCMNLPKIPDLGIDSILSNIFKNALDSLEAEGSINIATSLENNFVNISISDTGCGISKEHMEHIFEPFFTTKGTTKGTGLGLSICYDIVKRYNGKIDVVSDHGNGTKFIISLPVKDKNTK